MSTLGEDKVRGMIRESVALSRCHALDSLRTAMMFLGIDQHAPAAYLPKNGWAIE